MVYIENQDSDGDIVLPKFLVVPNVDSEGTNFDADRGTLVMLTGAATKLAFITERDVSVEIVTNT